jgi:hypothetical protein
MPSGPELVTNNKTTDNRPRVHRVHTDEIPPHTPVDIRIDHGRFASLSSSSSEPATVIRWETPPSRIQTPEQNSFETLRPGQNDSGADEAAYASNSPLVVRFDEEQVRNTEVEASKREGKMEDPDMDPYPPTPNTDDTPYIRFAIDQLTRDEDVKASQSERPSTNNSDYPVERIVPDQGLGYLAADREREAMRLVRKHRSSPAEGRLFNFNATRPLSYHSEPEVNEPDQLSSDSEIFIPADPPSKATRYPDLTFVPMILRPLSMITLSLLCLLMTAAIIFCAIYSTNHDGLVAWKAGIYGGRYFVFGFLPQILAACIFIYVQGVMAAMTRILPYTMMAMEDAEHRANALFLGVFPQSMLLPRWEGPLSFEIANSIFWLTIFTIPLQSSLFSVIQVDGIWRWTAVQGVAWTLVAIYLLVLIASVTFGLFFFRRTTGLMWDPRSLADMIALLPRSNSLKDYPGTDIMEKKVEIRDRLALRSDRLGYWRTQNPTQGIFYCIGEEGTSTRRYTLEAGKIEKSSYADPSPDVEKVAAVYSTRTRFRHVPWFLRDTFVILWAVAGFIFLLALIVVSFLPSTAIRKGFPASVSVAPNSAGYSAANFLYSFIPSVIGMLLYLFFQPLDMAIRKLKPWAELANPDGATAEKSLLLDYTAALPIHCTLSALSGQHYRIAILSLLSFLFVLLPVLAGGLFFPLTTPARVVRMIPNLPCFYIILAILILYFIGLLIIIPNRHEMHLPHDVDSLAEIFSFVYGSGMLDDAPFRAPKSKADLSTRLMAVKARGQLNMYAFGVYKGHHGKECLGIDKIGRRENEIMVLSGR